MRRARVLSLRLAACAWAISLLRSRPTSAAAPLLLCLGCALDVKIHIAGAEIGVLYKMGLMLPTIAGVVDRVTLILLSSSNQAGSSAANVSLGVKAIRELEY